MQTVSTDYLLELPVFDRVRKHTPSRINQRIDSANIARLERLVQDGPERIRKRLIELEREWDVDRALMATFAVLAGSTVLLGEKVSRKWLMLSAMQFGFLFYYASKGWCPPIAVLRRLGFRTVREIDAEKIALEALLVQSGNA